MMLDMLWAALSAGFSAPLKEFLLPGLTKMMHWAIENHMLKSIHQVFWI